LRPKLPKIIKTVDSKLDRFIITKRGKPAALLMSIDDYESLLETIDVLSDKKLIKRLRKAEKELEKGKVKALDEIEKEMGLA
jgi:prevent-host-death family protein